jgi:hypothetical protein
MQDLDDLAPMKDASVTRCNFVVMAAISFLTPVFENCFIYTIAEGTARQQVAELSRRCQVFPLEDSIPMRVRKKFNASPHRHLFRPRAGFGMGNRVNIKEPI